MAKTLRYLSDDPPIRTTSGAVAPQFYTSPKKLKVSLGGNISKLKYGGEIPPEKYYSIMDRVANENYRKWGFETPEAAFTHAINDPTYDYRGYYNAYPNGKGNAIDHWPDDFKTVYHPTFSNESIYSGKKSIYNPEGLKGGRWYGLGRFRGKSLGAVHIPSKDQIFRGYYR